MQDLIKSLETWYVKNKRDLPWRKTQDPYKILVSEVMLQQTTVRVVIPYYERFISEFPKAKTLANADIEKVLSLWSGLGYYSRARNLQKAMIEVVRRKHFPNNFDALLELPGVGPYTAAAVASMAFGEPAAAIDGNVIRVISRLFNIADDISTKKGQTKIKKYAQSLLNPKNSGLHNQALMELGATICVPKNPSCMLCPWMKSCRSLKEGTINLRPVKKKMRKQDPWLWTLRLIKKDGKIALVKNNDGVPWLKNTWVLPGKAIALKKSHRLKIDFCHSITHHKISVRVLNGRPDDLKGQKVVWIDPKKGLKVGVSSIVTKALKAVSE